MPARRLPLLLQLLIVLAAGCAPAAVDVACKMCGCGEDDQRRVLKVLLYPYVPDAAGDLFAAMQTRIKREFEERHPDVRLDVVIDPAADLYDLATLRSALGPDGYDLVEIDTALLPDLVREKQVAVLDEPLEDMVAEAAESVRIEGKTYGRPTWRCSTFVFSRDEGMARATKASELTRAFAYAAPGQRALIGDFAGSWGLPGLYLDALADAGGGAAAGGELSQSLDNTVADDLVGLIRQGCGGKGGNNPCTKEYHDATEPLAAVEDFVAGEALGLVGWSERLHFIEAARARRGDRSRLYVGSVPLAEGSRPLVWVDALVLNAQRPRSKADALAFARYYARVSTQVWIAMSQDAPPGTPPRYLLSASEGFLSHPMISRDAYYRSFKNSLSGAVPVSQRFTADREALYRELTRRLELPETAR